MTFRISALRLLSPDPELISAFYEAAFGTSVDTDGRLTLGRETIEFVKTDAKLGPGAPPNSTGYQHVAIVVSDVDAALAHLQTIPGWKAMSRGGPEQLPASSGGAKAFKFYDPDGHPIELVQVAENGGAAALQDQRGTVLGIDHTAITVSDTTSSIAFYQSFGFTVASRRLHAGLEQAQLDDANDVEVEITRLAPPDGAALPLNLLCYRRPSVRREPRGPQDVLATRIVLTGGNGLAGERIDPDGHRLIVEPGARPIQHL